MAVYGEGPWGLAFLDVSTGELESPRPPQRRLPFGMTRLGPKEAILSEELAANESVQHTAGSGRHPR